VCTQISPCGVSGGQSCTETDFSLEFFGFLVSIISLGSVVIYHLGDEQ
jgi:hypothetical protein